MQRHMAPKKYAFRLITKHRATYAAESAQNCGGVVMIFTSYFLLSYYKQPASCGNCELYLQGLCLQAELVLAKIVCICGFRSVMNDLKKRHTAGLTSFRKHILLVVVGINWLVIIFKNRKKIFKHKQCL